MTKTIPSSSSSLSNNVFASSVLLFPYHLNKWLLSTTFRFEGKFKSKRSIALGGASANTDKNSLVEKAHWERQQRELMRLKLDAAQKIYVCNANYFTSK